MRKFFDRFEIKQAAAIFIMGSLISGFFFLSQKFTENTVLNENYYLNIMPIVGLLLTLCPIVLRAYSVTKHL